MTTLHYTIEALGAFALIAQTIRYNRLRAKHTETVGALWAITLKEGRNR